MFRPALNLDGVAFTLAEQIRESIIRTGLEYGKTYKEIQSSLDEAARVIQRNCGPIDSIDRLAREDPETAQRIAEDPDLADQ